MKRPSYKELDGKLVAARQAVKEGRIALLNQLSLTADAVELDYSLEKELQSILADLLDESSPGHYAGSRPPQRSYEQDIEGLDLFAFAVESSRFNCRVYYKFALAEGTFWLVSLHQDQQKKEES